MADDQDDFKEQQHFASIVRAFDNYRPWALRKVAKLEADYRQLSPPQQELLRTGEKVAGMRACIEANAAILQRIVAPHRKHVGAGEVDGGQQQADPQMGYHGYVPESDMDKLQSTIKQFVREWGAEGAAEREQAHAPLFDALRKALPGGAEAGARVLLPGAGMGRLVWEAAAQGYTAQGSEFSYFMLIASNFILNGLQTAQLDSFVIHPWVLSTCNVRLREDQLRPARVPDVLPWSLPPTASMSMTAGDFLDVYSGQHQEWDAVCTCFFIDTAHDVTAYIRRIAELLVVGGVWVNLGPLLWHYSDMLDEVSIELTWDELRPLILSFGFTLEHEEWRHCGYVTNGRSMQRSHFDCVHFVARWPGHAAAATAAAAAAAGGGAATTAAAGGGGGGDSSGSAGDAPPPPPPPDPVPPPPPP